MKLGIRGGHTRTSPGASGYIDELTEDRKVYPKVKQLLSANGCEVIDLTPPESYAYPSELTYGINLANNSNLNYGMSIHFNASATTNNPLGSEIWIYDSANQTTKDMANIILNNLHNLGFNNRGLCYAPSQEHLGEIDDTNMPWILVEVCFVSSKADCDLYNKLGSDIIAKAIAEGVLGHEINQPQPIKQEVFDMKKVVLYEGDIDALSALVVSQKYGACLMKKSDYIASGEKAEQIVAEIGGQPNSTRFTTFKYAASLI